MIRLPHPRSTLLLTLLLGSPLGAQEPRLPPAIELPPVPAAAATTEASAGPDAPSTAADASLGGEGAAPAEEVAPGEATEAPPSPPPLTPENTLPHVAEDGSTRSDDFFAPDRKLQAAVAQLVEAVDRRHRPAQVDAMRDLREALAVFDAALEDARVNGLGPFAHGGNPAREALAALSIPKVMALKHLGRQAELGRVLKSLEVPPPRYRSRELAGIPLVKRGDPTRRVVALTFDDGPDPPETNRVLDVLRSHQVPATFFVVGRNVARHPEVVRRMVEEGHEVAHHSWDHPRVTQLTNAQLREQIQKTDAALRAALPDREPSPYFRLPYQVGHSSKRVHRVLAERFDYLIDWSVDSQDYMKRPVEQTVALVWKHIRHNGAIALFHDRRPRTAAVINELVTRLKADGWGFATVSDILGTDPAGERVRWLRRGLVHYAQGEREAAAKVLGNFTLTHPGSVAAPASLYASFASSSEAGRPKAWKLKDALTRRYPFTLYGLRLAGRLQGHEDFVPGGPRSPKPPAGPLELPEEEPESPPATAVAAAPAEPSAPVTTEATPEPDPAPRTLPPPAPTRTARLPRVLRPLPPEAPPTPLPPPYEDPAPELDGSHLVDPESGVE